MLADRITSGDPEWDDSKHPGGGSKSGQEMSLSTSHGVGHPHGS